VTKILITGCAGFIGSSLTEKLLEKQYEIVGIDNFDSFYSKSIKLRNIEKSLSNNNFKFIECDITNKTSLDNINNIDIVIHLAAKAGVLPSINDPEGYINTNIVGTNNVLDFMKNKGVKKMLFASSSSIYGNSKEIPFSETNTPDKMISHYAFTKRSCELLNHVYHHLYNIDIVNLRFFTVYGPRQRPDLAIHKFVKLIDEGKPITMYGDGSTSRDYTYIEDTVSGIIKAMQYISTNEHVFETANLGNNKPIKLKDLVEILYEEMNVPQQIEYKPMQPGDVDITYADISYAQKLFNYEPNVDFRQGIKNFIKWYYEQKN
jgi:nucleoside-diphosphate-sugar epimerase